MSNKDVRILYTNWVGVTEWRTILPHRIYWGQNEWHKTEQWILDGLCRSRKLMRSFAVLGIKAWVPVKGDSDVLPTGDGQGNGTGLHGQVVHLPDLPQDSSP